VTTDAHGRGKICLRQGSWTCDVSRLTSLQVLPKNQSDVLVELKHGKATCSTPQRPDEKFVMPGERLTMGGQVKSSAQRRGSAGESAAAGGGELFSMAVVKGKAVVKVRRSTGVLARAATTQNAVVIGRDQQAEATRGSDPLPPTKITLTPAERAVFDELARTLPKETDVSPPTVDVHGPPKSSSVRTATFTFTANEQAVFSCALDDTDFRLCTDSYSTPRLSPGPHIFKLRATDVAGNTGTTTYSWTIDGSRIAFESFRDGNPELYTVDPDGVDPKRLTTNLVSDDDPDWSPDRKQIVFQRDDEHQNPDIWTIDADGTGERRLTTDGEDRNPSWSPDGSHIAFEGGFKGSRQIWVMTANGTGETQLTFTPDAENFDPAWSPDGRRIAFASTRDGNSEIYSMNANGTDQTRLTFDEGNDLGPSWSKDGRIAFHGLQGGPYANIFVIEPNGSITRVTNDEHNNTNPSWAPDGEHIVFASDRDSTSIPPSQPGQELYVVDLVTHEQTRITDPATTSNFAADW
jgi:Tol biopolymer transport system component